MVQHGIYEGKNGTIITESDYNRATKIVYNDRSCYFIPYKNRAKSEYVFDMQQVIDQIKAGHTKLQIAQQCNLTVSSLNNRLFNTWKTSKLKIIAEILNKPLAN